jgi:hypothetical protein
VPVLRLRLSLLNGSIVAFSQVPALLRDYPFADVVDSLQKRYKQLPQGWAEQAGAPKVRETSPP